MRNICDVYFEKSDIRLEEYLGGLPHECFEDTEHEMLEPTLWSKTYHKIGGSLLGNMVHAFPRVELRQPSWTRTLEEPQYVLFKSDGDLNMISGLRREWAGAIWLRIEVVLTLV